MHNYVTFLHSNKNKGKVCGGGGGKILFVFLLTVQHITMKYWITQLSHTETLDCFVASSIGQAAGLWHFHPMGGHRCAQQLVIGH